MQDAHMFYQRFGQILGGVVLLLGILSTSVSPAWSQATSLFFSEYVEGSSNNKALEIYNGTGAAVDLAADDYKIEIYFNGNTTPLSVINLTGVIANGAVHVLADNSADAAILAVANQTSAVNFFNGDDAVALVKGTTLIDVIGQIGTDPGTAWGAGITSTMDHTLRRRPTVCAGDPNGSDAFEPSVEWLGFAVDTFDGLGAHSASCVDPGTLLAEIAALKIRVGLLEGQVEALGNHTHTYLTGKGEGHNNTAATTGPPVILED
jgi:predicted extracellular nuclease